MKNPLKAELLQALLAKPTREETPLEALHRQSFHAGMPAYILDVNFQYLDWNAAFDEIVARPLGLKRGMHGTRFVEVLANCDEVMERSVNQVFTPGNHPFIDAEPLLLQTERYGLVRFHKLAVQILDDRGQKKAWALTLNITAADNLERLWKDISDRLAFEAALHRYVIERDTLPAFGEANALILKKLITSAAIRGENCLELGSGQGALTESLLKNETLKICAQEDNVRTLELFNGRPFAHSTNLSIVKEGVDKLEEYPENFFGSVVSWDGMWRKNVSLSIFDQIARVLRPQGQVALLQRIAESGTPATASENDDAFARTADAIDAVRPLWTAEEIGRAADAAGLQIDRFETHRFERPFLLLVARKV